MTDFDMYLKMLLHDMQGNPTASRMLNKDKRRLTFNLPPYKPQTGNVYVTSYGNLVTPQIQDRNGQLTFIDNVWSSENDHPSYQQSLKFSSPEEAQYFAENYKKVAPMMQEQWDGNKVYNYFNYFK